MSTYRELKQANPKFPILVREAESAQAKLIARFGETARPCGTATLRCMCFFCTTASAPRARLAIVLADFGVEKSVDVEGMDAAGIGKQLEQLVASKPQ